MLIHQLYNLIYLSVCLASASWKWHIRRQKTRLHQNMRTVRIGKGALVQRDADLPSSMSRPLSVDLNRDNWRLQFLSSRYSDSVYTTSTHFLFMLDTYETVCSVPYMSKYGLWYDNHVLVLTAYSACSLQKRQGCVRILKLIHISNLLILFSGLFLIKRSEQSRLNSFESGGQIRFGRVVGFRRQALSLHLSPRYLEQLHMSSWWKKMKTSLATSGLGFFSTNSQINLMIIIPLGFAILKWPMLKRPITKAVSFSRNALYYASPPKSDNADIEDERGVCISVNTT